MYQNKNSIITIYCLCHNLSHIIITPSYKRMLLLFGNRDCNSCRQISQAERKEVTHLVQSDSNLILCIYVLIMNKNYIRYQMWQSLLPNYHLVILHSPHTITLRTVEITITDLLPMVTQIRLRKCFRHHLATCTVCVALNMARLTSGESQAL